VLRRRHKKKSEYRRMKSAALEREANIILYGTPTVPKRSEGAQYLIPKIEMPFGVKCSSCKKPISLGGSGMCRKCYLDRAKKKRIGSGKEIVDSVEYDRLTAIGYDAAGADGKIYRMMGIVQPDQIEVTYRGQVAIMQRTFHTRGVALSFEETEEVLDQLSRVA
jgi:hypothetical protein